MEEAKAYIETGILELYVLGQLSAPEVREVEAMAAQYPEVKQEIEAIELALEEYAVAQAVQPGEALEQKILEGIRDNGIRTVEVRITPPPPLVQEDLHQEERNNKEQATVIPINTQYESKIRTLSFALAACIALLVVSVVALYSAHSELGTAKVQIAELSLDKQKFTSTVNYMKQTNEELQRIADMAADPNWKFVKLAGTPMDPSANMMVYWHVTGRHVIMDNSKMHLPATDSEHQYQLWALVKGKPVDLGVFDVNEEHSKMLVDMKDIAAAQTFAVTLEKRGGVASPTMSQMIVAGNVAI